MGLVAVGLRARGAATAGTAGGRCGEACRRRAELRPPAAGATYTVGVSDSSFLV